MWRRSMGVAAITTTITVVAFACGATAGGVVRSGIHPEVPQHLFSRSVAGQKLEGMLVRSRAPSTMRKASCTSSIGQFRARVHLSTNGSGWVLHTEVEPIPTHVRRIDGVLTVAAPTTIDGSASDHLLVVRTAEDVGEVVARVAGRRIDGMAPVAGWAALLVESGGSLITLEAWDRDGEVLATLRIPFGETPSGPRRCLAEAP